MWYDDSPVSLGDPPQSSDSNRTKASSDDARDEPAVRRARSCSGLQSSRDELFECIMQVISEDEAVESLHELGSTAGPCPRSWEMASHLLPSA